jgi:hypothetical protein
MSTCFYLLSNRSREAIQAADLLVVVAVAVADVVAVADAEDVVADE